MQSVLKESERILYSDNPLMVGSQRTPKEVFKIMC